MSEETKGNSFWDRASAALGTGGALLELHVDDLSEPATLCEGAEISGFVAIEGGRADQQGEVRVAVLQQWVTMVYVGKTMVPIVHTKYYNDTILSHVFETAAHSDTVRLPFTLRIPEGVTLENEWFLTAAFAAEGAMSPISGRLSFKLLPGAVVQGLVATLVTASQVTETKVWGGTDGVYQCRFLPRGEQTKHLDGMHLTVKVDRDEDTVEGALHINPQEHTLVDHLRSIVGANNEKHPFSFPASAMAESAAADQEPYPAAVRYFRDCLAPHFS
jgi:hypothetical protein